MKSRKGVKKDGACSPKTKGNDVLISKAQPTKKSKPIKRSK